MSVDYEENIIDDSKINDLERYQGLILEAISNYHGNLSEVISRGVHGFEIRKYVERKTGEEFSKSLFSESLDSMVESQSLIRLTGNKKRQINWKYYLVD